MNAFEKAQQLGRDLKTAAGKAAMNLLPYVSLVESTKVAMFGAVKYPPGWTWTKPSEDWREKYGSAVVRHAMKWVDPTVPNVDIDIDAETGVDTGSGLSHMAHACFNAMICLWHEHRERQEQAPQPDVSRYARWRDDTDRPETRNEIVERTSDFLDQIPEREAIVIRPAVSGQPIDLFGIYRVILLSGYRHWGHKWRTRGLGLGAFMVVDERGRDLLFEVPFAVKPGDVVTIEVSGQRLEATVEYIDHNDLKMSVLT